MSEVWILTFIALPALLLLIATLTLKTVRAR
jgi:hypothetical protein